MLGDNQIFLALVFSMVVALLAIRLASTLYK